MTQQITQQKGAASSTPPAPMRWLMSKIGTKLGSINTRNAKRTKAERARVKQQRPHVVEYFHHVDDGYSHLTALTLDAITKRYDIELICHLVSGAQNDNSPEPELLSKLSRTDAYAIAPHYGLTFDRHDDPVDDNLKQTALAILAHKDNLQNIELLNAVSTALWSDDKQALTNLASEYGQANTDATNAVISVGNNRQSELKHYSGAMFYYEGEWYWGVDRLYHLEKRLIDLGAVRDTADNSTALIAERPKIEHQTLAGAGNLTLEIYLSLRSPYTAVIFDTAVQLARDIGVKLVLRPVLPMVMRGVSLTRQKGMYIFSDSVREAHELGVEYGNFYDPIGEPVTRGFSLLPYAREQNKEAEFISAFLNSAFAEGINTNNDKGMRQVVERAGLDWGEAKQHLGKDGWQDELEANRQQMYQSGLWGVPSFRLLDGDGNEQLATWGQDRLWLVARKIKELC